MRMATRLSAAVALSLTALTASATVINFDDLVGASLSAGTVVTNQYAGQGVTFQPSGRFTAHAENFLGSLMPGSSASNVLWTDQGGGGTTGQFLEVLFSSAVTGVSALFGTSLGADLTLEVYDGTTLLDSVTMIGSTVTGDVRSGTIGLGNVGITSARFFSTSGSNTSFNFSIDNLTFDGGTVPEPASAALVLLALGGLGAVKRRQQA